MRRPLLLLGSVLVLAGRGAPSDEVPWQLLKGKHFLVSYQKDKAFAHKVLQRAESDYDRITQELGFTRRDGFWLWDRRVRILIYPSRNAYITQAGAPAWAAGQANYVERTISTFRGSDDFVNSVLPHEMTHLIFREFVGFDSDIPLWLDEGIAQWEDKSNREKALKLARRLYRRGELMSLETLTNTDVRSATSGRRAVEFYAQSVSLVGFMITDHGATRFRKFCGHLRDGKTIEDALRFTYPSSMRNLKQLETAWLKTLGDDDS